MQVNLNQSVNQVKPNFKASFANDASTKKVLENFIRNEKETTWATQFALEDIKTNELIKIRGKGGKDRYVPLLEEVKETINLYIKNCPYRLSPKDALFLGARGERVTRVIQRRLQEIRNKLNLPDNITPHALRHSFATHLLKEGTDLRSIQELLGHASLSSTQRYTDVDLNKIKLEYNKAFPD